MLITPYRQNRSTMNTLRWLAALLVMASPAALAVVAPITGTQSIPVNISGNVGARSASTESCSINGASVDLRFNNEFVTTAANALKVTCNNAQGLIESSARLSTTPAGVCGSIPAVVGPLPDARTTLSDYTISRIELGAATSGSYVALDRFNAGSSQNNDKSISIQARVVAISGGNPAPGQIFTYDAVTGDALPVGAATNLYLFYGDTYVEDGTDAANCSATPNSAPQSS